MGPNELLKRMRDGDLGELLLTLKGDVGSLNLRFLMVGDACFFFVGAVVLGIGFVFGLRGSFLNLGIFPLAKYF